MEIVSNRLTRVEESLRKPLPRQEHETLQHEQATLKTVLAALERGKPLRENEMTDDQRRVTRAFRLFGEKPRVVFFNTADDESKPERFTSLSTPETPVVAIPAGLELELARMTPEDRAEFQKEMGVGGADRDGLIRLLMTTSGQRLFLTAGEKEVRTWLLHAGGTALDAAAAIHTDLAKGFIRAEIFDYRDLMRLGSEREAESPAPGAARAEGVCHSGRRLAVYTFQQVEYVCRLAEEITMPIHDWTRVRANRFHDFHQRWSVAISNALNAGRLPPGYFAMVEQKAGGPEPDVIALELNPPASDANGGVAVEVRPPKVRFVARTEAVLYALKANRIAVRHPDGEVVAVIEIVSPGNKESRHAIDAFAGKAADLLRAKVNVSIVDLFPPGPAIRRGSIRSFGSSLRTRPPTPRRRAAADRGRL